MLEINDIVNAIRQAGIVVKDIPDGMSYELVHSLSKEEFTNTIRGVLGQFSVKPQNSEWMPGTPTGADSDWGFYVYPKFPDDWEEGDFDLCILPDGIYWC